MISVRFGPVLAILNNGEWYCDEPYLLLGLQVEADMWVDNPFDDDPDRALAEHCARELGGVIVETLTDAD